MKKHILIIAIFLLGTNVLFSQENSQNLQKQFKLDVNFMGAGISYEIPLAKKWTVDLSTGIGGGNTSSNNFEWVLNSSLAIYLKTEFKYIYNREKRTKKGRTNANNSGNYFAFQTKYTSKRMSKSDLDIDPLQNSLLTEVHWGNQSSLGGNWLFNVHVGIGFVKNLESNESNIYPAIGLKFGYILF